MKLKEAQEAWDIFFNRFFSPEIPAGVDVEFNPKLAEFKPRENKNAKFLPPFNPEGREDHSDDFDDFLNGNTVRIPKSIKLTEERLAKVEEAILKGDFEAELFNEKDHVFYALWLFKQNKITRQQMSTLLARNQVNRLTPIRQTFQILDEKGNFTAEAKKLLLPIIEKNAFNGFSLRQRDRFRLLVQAAPKSEQIFSLSGANPLFVSHEGREQLGTALKKNRSWYSIKRKEDGLLYDLHYSFGATEALQIAISGTHEAAASRAQIGKISREQIKEGVAYGYRPVAVSIPDSGVEPTTKEIHDYRYSPMPAVTMHDVYHAKLHNAIPAEFHMMLNHLGEIISKHTKQQWSRTLWNLVDRELPVSFIDEKLVITLENGADIFCNIVNERSNPIFLKNKLTDEGIAILWHMVTHPVVWKNLYKVDIEKLDEPYKAYIQKMKAFSQTINKDEHPKLINLKFRLFCAVNSNSYQYLANSIDTIRDNLLSDPSQKLVFGKYNYDEEYKNQCILKLQKFKSGNDLLIEENNVTELIPFLLHKYLAQGNENFIQAQAEKIAMKFKSFSAKNLLTDEELDEALENFASIGEKVEFLEKCYELLSQSKAYIRRNPLLDNLFTFIRNPLTTSQRQHVSQLQTKLQKVLAEFHSNNELDKETKEEMQWYLNHRGSKLARVHTEQFMVNLSLPLVSP